MNQPEQIVLKREPELRHALAHICNAIEALAEGHPLTALHELRSIESVIFFEGDDEMEAFLQHGGTNGTETQMHQERRKEGWPERRAQIAKGRIPRACRGGSGA